MMVSSSTDKQSDLSNFTAPEDKQFPNIDIDESISFDNTLEHNVNIARKRNAKAVRTSFENENSIILGAAPSTGKTTSVLSYAVNHGNTVVLGLPTYELIKEKREDLVNDMEDIYGASDPSVLTVKSADKSCPCLLGEHGEDVRETIQAWRNSGLSGGRIHALVKEVTPNDTLPCQDPDCPFMEQWDDNFDKYELILTTHGMTHSKQLLEDKKIAIDEFDDEMYQTEVSNPEKKVNRFLSWLDTDLEQYNDLFSATKDEKIQYYNKVDREMWEFECFGNAPKDSAYHTAAPDIVETALEGDSVGVKWVFNSGSNTYKLGDGKFESIKQPNFNEASAVVALDATGRERMWNKFINSDLEFKEITNNEETRVLWEQNGGRIFTVGNEDALYPANSDNPGLPYPTIKGTIKMMDLIYEEHGVFSTKKVQTHGKIKVDGYYNKDDRGTNNLSHLDAMFMVGTPTLSNRAIKKKAEWFGIELDIDTIQDFHEITEYRLDKKFSVFKEGEEANIVDDIQYQSVLANMEQAMWRPNRTLKKGADVFFLGGILPDWVEVNGHIPILSKIGEKEQLIEKVLKKALESNEWLSTNNITQAIKDEYGVNVTDRAVRKTINGNEDDSGMGILKDDRKDPNDSRITLYRYSNDGFNKLCEHFSERMVKHTPNGTVLIDSKNGITISEIKGKLESSSYKELKWMFRAIKVIAGDLV